MDRQGQASDADGLAAIAAIVPTTVGILVVCGLSEDQAAAHVEREVRRAVRDGALGGRDLPTELAVTALERAPRPSADRDDPSASPVEHAVRALPWPERLATVAEPVLGRSRLGSGRPDELADALGVRRPGWDRPADPGAPSAADLLVAAVERRTPPADPDLEARLTRAGARPARTAALVLAGVVVVGVVVAAVVLAWSPWSDTADEPAREAFRIRQWVAVLETGPTPASLAGKAAELGEVAGVNVFTDRWECYEGFPGGRVGTDDWFLGIASVDRAVVERLVGDSGRQPLLLAEVFQTCVLPPPSDFPPEP